MWLGTSLLFFCLCFRPAIGEEPTYKKEGSEVVLKPGQIVGPIKNILWKHGDNFAMESFGTDDSTIAYRQFKERGALDIRKGDMTIRGLTRDDSGVYTVEINNQVNKKITLEVLASVLEPTISASRDGDQCHLTCEGETVEAAPVSYNWIMDNQLSLIKTKEYRITKDDQAEFIQCELENPVSSQKSATLRNPFFIDYVVFTEGMIVGVVVGVILALAVVVLVVLAVLHVTDIYTAPYNRICRSRATDPASKGDDAANKPMLGNVESGLSDDPTKRPNGTEAAAAGTDAGDAANGPQVEVSANVHRVTYENVGPAREDTTANGQDKGDSATSSHGYENPDADKPDDGKSVPDNKPQEDELKDTEG